MWMDSDLVDLTRINTLINELSLFGIQYHPYALPKEVTA